MLRSLWISTRDFPSILSSFWKGNLFDLNFLLMVFLQVYFLQIYCNFSLYQVQCFWILCGYPLDFSSLSLSPVLLHGFTQNTATRFFLEGFKCLYASLRLVRPKLYDTLCSKNHFLKIPGTSWWHIIIYYTIHIQYIVYATEIIWNWRM